MRKDGSVLAVQPMENLDRQFDFNSARHVKKCSRRNQRFMERSKLRRAEHCRLRHEMFSEKIGVLDHGALERLKDDAPLLQLLGNNVAFDKLITSEDQSRGHFIEPARLLENRLSIVVR